MKALNFSQVAIFLEVILVYALIQGYIWRWQFTWPELAWPLLLLLLATHLWRKDTMEHVGFRLDNLVPALRLAALASIPFLLILLAVGTVWGDPWRLSLADYGLWRAARYILWATFQQYGLQGYFHNRLRRVIPDPWLSSTMNGFLFMSLHLPNPVLMVFTLLGGLVLSLVYRRQPNIFALGLFHGLTGLLLSVSFPPEILHNMRVGPRYYW